MNLNILLSAVSSTSWYHGSPSPDVMFNQNAMMFFTKDFNVARQYALGQVAFTGKVPKHTVRHPTVYEVALTVNRIFDFRIHRNEYEALRNQALHGLFKTNPLFWDGDEPDFLPKSTSEGFIHSHTGLPGYGRIKQFQALLHDYDGMYVDEGSQGISLVVFNTLNKVSVLNKFTI